MAAYKNIIFDLGGVLLNIDYHRTRSAFEDLGIKDFDRLYSQADASDLFRKLEKGTITPADFYEEFLDLVKIPLTVQQVKNAWNAMLLDFREDSLKYLEALKDKANLILLSNTNAIHVDEIREIYYGINRNHPFEDYFHHCVYSFETGTRKPDAACYNWVLQNTGINASESIFIDDSVQNIKGAETVGIKSVLLEPGRFIENIGLEKLIS